MIAATIARHWPFANGSGRILDKFAKGSLGTGETIVRTSDGFSIYVLRDDLIGRHIALSGKFDRSIVQVLLNRAKPGDVLLDIGANIGYFSACFLSRVPNSRAICIEPQTVIVDLLRKNVAQFDGRSEVIQIGLADHDGSCGFTSTRATGVRRGLVMTARLRYPFATRAKCSNRSTALILSRSTSREWKNPSSVRSKLNWKD